MYANSKYRKGDNNKCLLFSLVIMVILPIAVAVAVVIVVVVVVALADADNARTSAIWHLPPSTKTRP